MKHYAAKHLYHYASRLTKRVLVVFEGGFHAASTGYQNVYNRNEFVVAALFLPLLLSLVLSSIGQTSRPKVEKGFDSVIFTEIITQRLSLTLALPSE